MINVKIVSEDDISNIFTHNANESDTLGNCRFFVDDNVSECDYCVILSNIDKDTKIRCPPTHNILVTLEPVTVLKYKQKFLDKFALVVTSQENLKHKNIIKTHTLLTWFLDKTYNELVPLPEIKKTKTLSIICSDKTFTKQHYERYKFCKDLEGYFGDRADFYGRGIHDFNDKWDVLAPYKYSLAIENSSSNYYVTEKIFDCFLTLTYPLYYGCKNITDYYPQDSFSVIDFHDFDKTVNQIETIISAPNFYEDHLHSLMEARDLYLNQYEFFPAIVKIINQIEKNEAESGSIIKKPADILLKAKKMKVIRRRIRMLPEYLYYSVIMKGLFDAKRKFI